MATTTVRLSSEEAALLDSIADQYGGRSNALRAGLRSLAAATQRQQAIDELLSDWEDEAGPVERDAVDEMIRRYDL